nr:immunoglobulin heavy chain junction region [Mus musculus]
CARERGAGSSGPQDYW